MTNADSVAVLQGHHPSLPVSLSAQFLFRVTMCCASLALYHTVPRRAVTVDVFTFSLLCVHQNEPVAESTEGVKILPNLYTSRMPPGSKLRPYKSIVKLLSMKFLLAK